MGETAEEAGRKLRVKARKHYSEDCLQDVDIEGQRMFSVEEKLLSDQFTPDFVKEMKGEDFNMEYVQREGFQYPLLFKEKKGLGIRVPSENFSVHDVRQCVGNRRVVDVMDVTTQKDQEMSMKEWCHYFEDPHRDKLLNVISLEFSHTKLENYVESPEMVRQIDWVDCVWPRHLKESQTVGTNTIQNMKYPKVRKYCLMSVKGCYTDFHIDFGGTSVWYHIIKGKKVFWLIPPTEENIQHYEKWVLSGKQGDVFFGDTVPKCARVNLEQGYTFFIPSGWIHAVYTPSDSLVFGGNFLHSFGIQNQLRISEVEDLTKVPFKFRYPFYTELLWYVLQRYVHCVSNKNHLTCNEEGEPLDAEDENKDPAANSHRSRERRKVLLTQYELSGLATIVHYLEVKLPRKSVPYLIRDPQLLLQDAKDMLKEHCHDDPQSAVTGKPILFWEGIKKAKRKRKTLKLPASSKHPSSSNICKNGVVRHRRTRCKKCEPCQRNDCEECNFCRDMKKFGGPGRMKQSCRMRQCVGPILAHSAVCNICKEDGWKKENQADGITEEDGPNLMECSLCWEIVHPLCLQAQSPDLPKDTRINDDLPSSWQCPKCFHGGAPEEVKPRTIKLKKFGTAEKKRKHQDDSDTSGNKKANMEDSGETASVKQEGLSDEDMSQSPRNQAFDTRSTSSHYKEEMAHLFVTSSEDEEEDLYFPERTKSDKTLSEQEMRQLFAEDDDDEDEDSRGADRGEEEEEEEDDARPSITEDYVDVEVGCPSYGDYAGFHSESTETAFSSGEAEASRSPPPMEVEEIIVSSPGLHSLQNEESDDLLGQEAPHEPVLVYITPTVKARIRSCLTHKEDLPAQEADDEPAPSQYPKLLASSAMKEVLAGRQAAGESPSQKSPVFLYSPLIEDARIPPRRADGRSEMAASSPDEEEPRLPAQGANKKSKVVSKPEEETAKISYIPSSPGASSPEIPSPQVKDKIKTPRLEEDIFSKRKTVDFEEPSIQEKQQYPLFSVPSVIAQSQEPAVRINPALSQEVMLKVFAHLLPTDLYRCQLVCKSWSEWVLTPFLWTCIDASRKSITPYLLMGIVKRQPEELDLGYTDISGVHLSWLIARLPQLKDLSLRGCDGMAVASLWTAYCPCLRSLDLGDVQGLDDSLMERLLSPPALHDRKVKNRLRQLRRLDLSRTAISDLTLRVLAHRLQSLSSLSLSSCPNVSDLGVAVLGAVRAPTLVHLDLSHCPAVSDTSLDTLARCLQLLSLNLRGCPLVSPSACTSLLPPSCQVILS